MLGLDRGGACRGIAFRVAEKNRADVVAYLRAREQVTSVYREVMRSVWLENDARQRVSALAYVVDRGHVQYAGRLSLADQHRHVLQGHGRSGANRDYVTATVKAIEAEGFRDAQLHQLATMLHGDAHSPHAPAPAERSRKPLALRRRITRRRAEQLRLLLAARFDEAAGRVFDRRLTRGEKFVLAAGPAAADRGIRPPACRDSA